MARVLALAASLSSVDGGCIPFKGNTECGCKDSYNDGILGMESKYGKVNKPIQKWVQIKPFDNTQSSSVLPVTYKVTGGHTKTRSTTWSVGIGAELEKLGIKADASLSRYNSQTWSESFSYTMGPTNVPPHKSKYLCEKFVTHQAHWARRVRGSKVIADCGGSYEFKSNAASFDDHPHCKGLNSFPKTEVVVTSENTTVVVV